jgi:hypothetical protein
MEFNEDFLHFIWRFRLLDSAKLVCAEGEELQILHPGILNKHAGPDFSDAKLVIDETSWAGHVEIHLKSSDWSLHGHQHDAFYDGVILHVVYQHDRPIYRTNGSLVPVLVVAGLFSDQLLNNYRNLAALTSYFPCEKQIGALDPLLSVLNRSPKKYLKNSIITGATGNRPSTILWPEILALKSTQFHSTCWQQEHLTVFFLSLKIMPCKLRLFYLDKPDF